MEYYTAAQLSRMLGISVSVLKEMIKNKEIEGERTKGGTYRIPESEILNLTVN